MKSNHEKHSFPYKDYERAKKEIRQALNGPPFYGLVDGGSGMGKTSLIRDLSSELDRYGHRVVYLSSPQASSSGIARFLCQSFHVTPKRNHLETTRLLVDAIIAHSAHLLLWIDEADQVDSDTLQEVRMLAETDMRAEQIFSVIFSGLPALNLLFDNPRLFPLKRRISVHCHLSGLQQDELGPFLKHKLTPEEVHRIPEALFNDLFERTQGTPALIEKVVRLGLSRIQDNLNQEVIHAALETYGL
jgi:general secretion pathway protein A